MDDVHTETEARRLLAAAVDTISADADLLGEVRRRARHRRRAQAALAASSAAAVTAGALVAATATGTPSALAAVTSAAAKTSADSYRVSTTSTTVLASTDPNSLLILRVFENLLPERVTGEFDPARHIGEETSSDGGQWRYIGQYMYTYVSMHKGWLLLLPAGKNPAHLKKSWLKVPLSRGMLFSPGPLLSPLDLNTVNAVNTVYTVTPQDLLALLKSASTVRDEGPASGPGWTGTRYSFSETSKPGLYKAVRGTVFVDQQGRVRRMEITRLFPPRTGLISDTSDITFSDFGVRVTVTPPPATRTSDRADIPIIAIAIAAG